MSGKEENLNEINNKRRDSTLPPPKADGTLGYLPDNKKNEEKQGNLDEIEDLNLMKEALESGRLTPEDLSEWKKQQNLDL